MPRCRRALSIQPPDLHKEKPPMLKQLLAWPPTATTVIGLGLVLGAVDYLLTGSAAQAVLIAGLFKIVCPQDTAAVDKLDDVLNQLPAIAAAANRKVNQ